MFIDIDCTQEKKYNQNAYGDYFTSRRYPDSGRLIAVLSDGLGSGVKANILSCMTSTMLLKFMEAQRNIEHACETVLNSLPVCQVRKISYSTFSAIDCDEDGKAKIVEEGNPEFVWLRGNEVMEPVATIISSKTHSNRHMKIYDIKLELGDRLIFCSDGVTQAGLGGGKLKLGLRRSGLIDFLKEKLTQMPEISSRELSKKIVKYAQSIETDKLAKDDISALVIYYRKPREVLVFTGPPYHQKKDGEYAQAFKNFNGKKAICGGTTANLISRELKSEIITGSPLSAGKLPPTSSMQGVDLITEGILTLTLANEYLEDSSKIDEKNAATKLIDFFLNSDYIHFMVGAGLNQAHYDPNLPVEIEIRKNIIKKLAHVLEEKYLKKVEVQFV